MLLRDKKVIVTGGVRGLGRAIVETLLLKEARITVFDRDARGLSELRTKQKSVDCVECDVANYEQVVTAVDRFYSQSGTPEVLVNNAGILYSAPLVRLTASGLERHDAKRWNEVLKANLSSVFYMTSCVVEKMIFARSKGVIANVSSVSAGGNPGASAYSAAKAGVNALTTTWARELGPMGIRVVAVAPGFIDNESTRLAISETVLQKTIERVPLRRLGQPEEIAAGVISVIENDYFNGKVFELDGGLII